MAWDSPVAIIAMFLGALAVFWWLLRVGTPRDTGPAFDCFVCGRKERARVAAEWRYCPYCGVPRDSKTTKSLPRGGGKSILDM